MNNGGRNNFVSFDRYYKNKELAMNMALALLHKKLERTVSAPVEVSVNSAEDLDPMTEDFLEMYRKIYGELTRRTAKAAEYESDVQYGDREQYSRGGTRSYQR
jgi:hypothetical protein